MIDRIKKILEKEGNNPSTFADYIGISRSAMNHILNGRNNPSLDVLMKILGKYESINTDWLLFGKLPMYKGEKAILQHGLFDEPPVEPPKSKPESEYRKEVGGKPIEIINKQINNESTNIQNNPIRKITHLIIFYSDGTFETLRS